MELLRDFEERGQELAELWHAVCELSKRVSLHDPEGFETDQGVIDALLKPVRLSLVGEKGSGRSDLVVALTENPALGHDESGHYLFRHRELSPVVSNDTFEVNYLREPLLKKIEIASACVSGVDLQPWEARDELAADVILLVFSAHNPWCAGAWNWFERHQGLEESPILLVLVNDGSYSASELTAMRRHMREICHRRSGIDRPLIEWGGETSMAELQQELSQTFSSHSGLKAKLLEASKMLDRRQRAIEDVLDSKRRLLREDGGFLEALESGISKQRETMTRGASAWVKEGAEVYLDASAKGIMRLRALLGVWSRWIALVWGERLPKRFDRELYDQAGGRFHDWAGMIFDQMCSRLQTHWNGLEPEAAQQLKLRLGDFPLEELHPLKQRFQDRAEDLLRRVLLKLALRKLLLRELQHYKLLIGSWFILGLLFWAGGTLLGVLGFDLAGIVAVALAGLCLLMSTLRVWYVRREIREQVRRRLVGAVDDLEQNLGELLGAEIRLLTARYRACFAPVNEHIARSREDLFPQFERWREIYLRLKSLQQQL